MDFVSTQLMSFIMMKLLNLLCDLQNRKRENIYLFYLNCKNPLQESVV